MVSFCKYYILSHLISATEKIHLFTHYFSVFIAFITLRSLITVTSYHPITKKYILLRIFLYLAIIKLFTQAFRVTRLYTVYMATPYHLDKTIMKYYHENYGDQSKFKFMELSHINDF